MARNTVVRLGLTDQLIGGRRLVRSLCLRSLMAMVTGFSLAPGELLSTVCLRAAEPGGTGPQLRGLLDAGAVAGGSTGGAATRGGPSRALRPRQVAPDGRFYGPEMLTDVDGTLFFMARVWYEAEQVFRECLWKSDGSANGTVLVRVFGGERDRYGGSGGLHENHHDPYTLAVNGKLYFFADDGVHGTELWRSDGTESGTVMLANTAPGPESSIGSLHLLNGSSGSVVICYVGYDGQLWRSNGEVNGTVQIPGPEPNFRAKNVPMAVLNRELYLRAWGDVSYHGVWCYSAASGYRLLRADNDLGLSWTAINTTYMGVWGGLVFFAGYDDANDVELWCSDGTAGGTVLCEDLVPGGDYSYPDSFTPVESGLYFFADSQPDAGCPTLWQTTGPTGTTATLGAPCFARARQPLFTQALNQSLFFVADDGTHGNEPWFYDRSNGTTTMLADIDPGVFDSVLLSTLHPVAVLGDRVYFVAYGQDAVGGSRLWTTDGTPAGTFPYDLGGPNYDPEIQEPTACGSRLFFQAYSSLWVLDEGVVVTLSPTPGATSIRVDTSLEITLGSSVRKGASGSITIKRSSDNTVFEQIPVSDARVSLSGAKATVNPNGTLANATQYYVLVDGTCFRDGTGQYWEGVSTPAQWSFTTVPMGFAASAYAPLDDATNVAVGANLVLTFARSVLKGATGSITIKRASDGAVFEQIPITDARVTVSGSQATINPTGTFANSTQYYVLVDGTCFRDEADQAWAGVSTPGQWSFTTAAGGAAASAALYAWGSNFWGQLGDGTTTDQPTPVQVIAGGVTKVVAGTFQTLILKADGSLWACGGNYDGQLGDGATEQRHAPVQVSGCGPGTVASMAAGGSHTLILKTDGSLHACGGNMAGQLGDGTTERRTTPVPVSGCGPGTVTAVAAGAAHSLILKADASLWACGSDSWGELGDGRTVPASPTPTPVAVSGCGPGTVAAIAAGPGHSLIVKVDGSLWACGANGRGQLGDGTNDNRAAPGAVSGCGPNTVAEVAAGGGPAGDGFTLILKRDGSLYGCGANYHGQLGDGSTTEHRTPVQISGCGPGTVAGMAAGGRHTLIRKADGSLWACGSNSSGALGDGTMGPRLAPVRVRVLNSGVLWVAAGAESFSLAVAIPPPAVASLAINGGAVATANRAVILNNTCTGGATEFMASEAPDFAGASWLAYAAAPSFVLSAGDGLKTVYVKVRKGSVESAVASDTIALDTTAPAIAISTPAAPLTRTGPVTYTVTYTGADSVSLAPADVALNRTGSANGTVRVDGFGPASRAITIFDVTGDGTLGISIAAGTATDAAGNRALAAGPSGTFVVDNTAPVLAPANALSPADNAVGVAADAPLRIRLSEPITLGSGNVTIRRSADQSVFESIPVSGHDEVTVAGSGVTIAHAAFEPLTGYYVLIDAGCLRDAAGNPFQGVAEPTTWEFTTALAPTAFSPAPGATGVALDANLGLTFSRPVLAGSGAIEIRDAADDRLFESIPVTDTGRVTVAGTQVTINPAAAFAEDTNYYVLVPAGAVTDELGRPWAGVADAQRWGFTAVLLDGTPASFSFPPVTGAPCGTWIASNPVTVSGISTSVPISVTGGEYCLNDGAWMTDPGRVTSGDQVRVRVMSAVMDSSMVRTALTMGGVGRMFCVTTATRLFAAGSSGVVEILPDGTSRVLVPSDFSDLQVTGRELYLANQGAISVYDLAGTLRRTIPVSAWHLGFCCLPGNRFALFDNRNDTVDIINQAGELLARRTMLHDPDQHLQCVSGLVLGNTLYISEDGNKRVLAMDLWTYGVTVFRNLSAAPVSWLSALGYAKGQFYVTSPADILSFSASQGPALAVHLPASNITGLAIDFPNAWACVNSTGQVFRINLMTYGYQAAAQGLGRLADIAVSLSTMDRDTDADELPDDWEFAHFANLDQTSSGDPDGDGASNGQEYASDTDPMQDEVPPSVTINQATGQSDPTRSSPILFTAVFSEAVTGFRTGDVRLTGTARATRAAVREVAPNDGTTYEVAVTGMRQGGTVVVAVPSGVATDAGENPNLASTGADGAVIFIGPPPALSLGEPSVALTRSGPVTYTVTYTGADTVTLARENVTLNRTGSANGGVSVSGTDTSTRTVTISQITGDGTLGVSLAAGTATDAAGAQAAAAGPSPTFTVDNTAPTATLAGAPVGLTTQTGAAVAVSGTDVTHYRYRLDDTRAWSEETPVAIHILLSGLIDGAHTLAVIGRDAAGNWQPEAASTTAAWTVDATPPAGTISINSGALYTDSTTVTLTLSSADGTGSGVTEVSLRTGDGAWGRWAPFVATRAWTLPAGDGVKRVYARFRDAAGNESAEVSDVITLNALGLAIEGLQDDDVPSRKKTWHWSSAAPGATFRYAIDQVPGGAPSGAYDTVTSATQSGGDGTFYLHVQARDGTAGAEGTVATVHAVLDNTAPVVTDLDNDPGPVRTKTWNWTARDADSAIVYRFLVDQSAGGVPGGDYGAIATATKDAADGLWYLHVQARDRAGNATAVRTVSVTLDNTPPTVMINQAATQADPVATGPVLFTVVFSEPVTDFGTGDVVLGGTAGARTATVAEIAPNDGTTYQVAVSRMAPTGTVMAAVAAGVAHDAAGNPNLASTSTDNTVTCRPPDFAGSHTTTGYVAGRTCTVLCSLTFTGTPTALAWAATLPPGWAYAGGSDEPEGRPSLNDTDRIEWTWSSIPAASPARFSYTLSVPGGESGEKRLTATVTGSYGGGAIRHAVTPDPLLIEVVGRFALNLAPGWNLVSLPVEPRDPAAATVLAATRAAAEGAAGAAARAVRQDRAATIHEGNVWRWIPGRPGYYQAVSELHALTGYWIYAGTAARVTVQGTPMGGTVSLPAEWNLVGPAAAVPVPANARLAGALWRWDAIAVGYTALGSTDLLLPGHGYWLFATDAVVLSLGQ